MTHLVTLIQLDDTDAEMARRKDIKAWWQDNLQGKVTTEQSMVVNTYEVVNGELMSSTCRLWHFNFTNKTDALQFKLVFG